MIRATNIVNNKVQRAVISISNDEKFERVSFRKIEKE